MARRVLITGAGVRVGRALALELARDGWQVAVHYNTSHEAADAVVREITQAGGAAVSVGGNLANTNNLDALIPNAAQALGGPMTALINNASTFENDQAQTFTRESWDLHFEVNLFAPVRLSQAFALALPEHETGAIVNIIDQRVLKPAPTFFTYYLSKATLLTATKTLAQSLAPRIRVNAIGPGPTLRNVRQSEADFSKQCAATLLQTGSPPDTLVEAARFLLQARAVTGQMLAVDGGQHLTWETPDIAGITE